jgi:hypothetical protein
MPPWAVSLGLCAALRICLHFPTASFAWSSLFILTEFTPWHSSGSVLSCPIYWRSLPWLLWLSPSYTLPLLALTSHFLLPFPITLSPLLVHLDMTGQTRPSSFSSALHGACASVTSTYTVHIWHGSGWTRIHPEGCSRHETSWLNWLYNHHGSLNRALGPLRFLPG